MLINEILTKSSPNIKQSPRAIRDTKIPGQNKIVGIGGQTIAFLHQKFPDKIIKTVQISGTDDPVYQFIRLATKHQNNPWFPRIYFVKQYKSDISQQREDEYDELNIDDTTQGHATDISPWQQKYTLIVVMEKLQQLELSKYSVKDLEQIFSLDITGLTKGKMKGLPNEKSFYVLSPLFKEAKNRQMMYNNTKNPQLKHALRLLEPLFRNYASDINHNNIMLRPPNQFVFMDPIQTDLKD